MHTESIVRQSASSFYKPRMTEADHSDHVTVHVTQQMSVWCVCNAPFFAIRDCTSIDWFCYQIKAEDPVIPVEQLETTATWFEVVIRCSKNNA